ncbi:MAG: hypothetical protein MR023_03835 [Blautia sp.]|nr:hypothetical protein [Blautia sp.]MDY2897928.1 hypothetical protein [Candidatus Limivivens sp.]
MLEIVFRRHAAPGQKLGEKHHCTEKNRRKTTPFHCRKISHTTYPLFKYQNAIIESRRQIGNPALLCGCL